ncbi:hypothetical protein TRVL_09322 [Trypanosoma vivax]|nr:hypothetical protein TRVL_09322 [Trypanosoma vivax]
MSDSGAVLRKVHVLVRCPVDRENGAECQFLYERARIRSRVVSECVNAHMSRRSNREVLLQLCCLHFLIRAMSPVCISTSLRFLKDAYASRHCTLRSILSWPAPSTGSRARRQQKCAGPCAMHRNSPIVLQDFFLRVFAHASSWVLFISLRFCSFVSYVYTSIPIMPCLLLFMCCCAPCQSLGLSGWLWCSFRMLTRMCQWHPVFSFSFLFSFL